MRILLTNNHLAVLRGSETATYCLAVALRRADHDVRIATRETGIVTARLEKEGFKVTTRLKEWRGIKFDVAHVHHNSLAESVRNNFPNLPMVYLSHGIIPDLEKPPNNINIVERYLGVSEEVCAMLKKHKIKETFVLRNSVDCGRFAPINPINEKLENVMILSNHYAECYGFVKDACDRLGIKNLWLVGSDNVVWNVEDEINKADLVISLGRGVVESMACGRAVLVFDCHGCDGMITEKSYNEIKKNNFSGRRFAAKCNSTQLSTMLKSYKQSMGDMNRTLALKHHNLDIQVKDLEKHYLEAILKGETKMKNIDGSSIFIFGVPRSGTTWVLKLLSSHPDIMFAGPKELSVTSRKEMNTYESGVFALRYSDKSIVRKFKNFTNENPDKMFVEKTPVHVFHAERIKRLFPNSRFVFVKRNARDVIASMLVAGRKEDSFWTDAPKDVESAYKLWKEYNDACKAALVNFGGIVIRYERLHMFPKEELKKLFQYSIVTTKHNDSILSDCENGKNIVIEGVYNTGKVGSWKEVLTDEEKAFLENKF